MFSRWFGYRVYAQEIELVDGDSLHWRRGGWPDGIKEGTRKIRLKGLEAPAIGGLARSEQEALWGDAAKTYLEELIERARRLKLKPTGKTTDRGDALMTLYADGKDVAEIMIGAHMARPPKWDAHGKFVRYNWAALWHERPEVLR
jgi:endonuclease YncB( thermonuclease family)